MGWGTSCCRFLVATGLLALTACGNLSSNTVYDESNYRRLFTGSEDIPQLATKLATPLITSGHEVGIVIGVLDDDGRKQVFGFGRKSLTSPEPPDGSTIFAVGSITKAFLSVMAHDLIQSGKLSESEEVGDLLAGDMPMSPAARKITVGELLNHSSGLPRQPNDKRMFLSLLHYSFTGDNIYGHIDKARVSRFLADFDPDDRDVGHYRYSNLGSGLLARALEVKFGKPLYDQLSENLLNKIGTRDTVMDLDPSRAARLADAHVGDSPFFVARGTRIGQWKMSDILRGAAGLYSSADDLVELLRYRMTIDTIPTVRFPVQGHPFSVRRNLYQDSSYGWQVDFIVPDEFQIIFQHGMISGYTAYVGFIPDEKIGVVVLTNSFNWDDHIGHNMLVALSRRWKKARTAAAP